MPDNSLIVSPQVSDGGPAFNLRRRSFLKFAGASLALAATSSATRQLFGANAAGGVNLGSGDIGVLNYAYALEQLEAAFYTKVTNSFYAGASGRERDALKDIYGHEVAHREFLKGALGGSAIADLEFNFDTIDFHSRRSVLETARTLKIRA